MLSRFKKYITEGKTYQSLEIFEVNGKDTFALLILENQKGELEVIKQILLDNLEDVLQAIDKKKPLLVTFNTSKVLKKQVATEAKNNPELLVINAFPNLELDNFYFQLLEGKVESVVSISKKEHIDWYLEQLDKLGIKPFQIALGISHIGVFDGLLNQNLIGSNFLITIEDSKFNGYKSLLKNEEQRLNIDGISFQNWFLLGFAQTLSFLQKGIKPSNLNGINSGLEKDFKNERWYNFGLKFSLGFFLALLLLNFLVFSHYHEENTILEEAVATTENQDGRLKGLQSRIAFKEKRLEGILASKNSKTSFYLDELGKSIPSSVYLNEVQYQPLEIPVREKKEIELKKNSIQVSGVTNDKIQFTVWSDNLEMQDWIKRVEIMDYEYLSKSSANFSLNLILNP